jgi:hypothetical protein
VSARPDTGLSGRDNPRGHVGHSNHAPPGLLGLPRPLGRRLHSSRSLVERRAPFRAVVHANIHFEIPCSTGHYVEVDHVGIHERRALLVGLEGASASVTSKHHIRLQRHLSVGTDRACHQFVALPGSTDRQRVLQAARARDGFPGLIGSNGCFGRGSGLNGAATRDRAQTEAGEEERNAHA